MKKHESSTQLAARKQRAVEIIKRLRKLFPDPKIMLRYSNNWELLVAVILSAQCTDKKVNEVTESLFKKYRTLDEYANAPQAEFEKDIHSTGFFRSKAKNIIAAAKMVRDTYGGVVPKTMEEMIAIPGVARKTANVVLGNAYGIVEGIAVDTHVKRLAKRLGLTDEEDPVKIERDLMAVVPQQDWFELTYLLIDYGRVYCQAKPHKHDQCPLADLDTRT